MSFLRPIGIRFKLVVIFIFIKVLPLVALAWVAWEGIGLLGVTVREKVADLTNETQVVIEEVSSLAVDNSIRALDLKSRENIERLTTDTARAVASFLYARDNDIRLAAGLEPSEANYRRFLTPRTRSITEHKHWVLTEAGDAWVPAVADTQDAAMVSAKNSDNAKDFHYRPPDAIGVQVETPLFLEMTFVDLNGKERVKVTTSNILPSSRKNVSDPMNTYCKAEQYFQALKELKPGEIYVSEVIGAYRKSPIIGPFTRTRAEEKGVPFKPEEAGYAGKENPVGKRFQGLIRWATPVVKKGKVVGWVTLALDHTHVMEFTDHIVPTAERYSAISDAGSGNYAFMWDYKDRNISHPRDYFIVGYDPETGQPAIPWLEQTLYEEFEQSGMTIGEWEQTAPVMQEQSLKKKPAVQLIKQGLLGLDCRYLNFAPQCEGWYNLTKDGGSGSFVIFWSGLWKLTTAAAIPYYTGIYGSTKRGFGFVTIGANVHEFHRAATETGQQISDMAANFEAELKAQNVATQLTLRNILRSTTEKITYSTLIMVVLVIGIAFWMAATLTKKITNMIRGIRRFQEGDMEHRLEIESRDEVGQLAQTFNEMSDGIQDLIRDLQLAEENYRSFFENATEGIFRTTIDGRLVDVNPAFARLFGFSSPKEMIEKITNIGEELYTDPDRRKELLRLLEEHGSVREFEYEVKQPDGSTRVLLASCYFVTGEGGERYLEGMSTDITERRLKEQAEVDRESAMAASKAKSAFLANMSHELRTPMNALLGMAELLGETTLDASQRRYVDLFQSAGENLLKLLNEILDFSKIEAGQMAIDNSPMDIRETVLVVESIMSVQAENRGLALECAVAPEVPPLVLGDNLRLKQVLMNLVGNAVKFTEQGSVRVEIDLVEETDSTAVTRFKVRDTGMGIEQEKLSKVFESFTQADSSTTKKHGGTGLGLTIARELVQLMGGSLSVDSVSGLGTTFRFELPFEKFYGHITRLQSDGWEIPSDVVDVRPKRVLLAEDSESNRMLIEHYLKGTGHELTMCYDGQEAVDVYMQSPDYDLVIMDILMPVMDGIEATKRIRSHEEEQGLTPTPIMALTANAFDEDREACLQAGCTMYLAKPVRKAELLRHISQISKG